MKKKKRKLYKNEKILLLIALVCIVRIAGDFILCISPLPNYIGYIYEDQQYNEHIFVEGKASEFVLKEIDKGINGVPKLITNLFYDMGGTVYVTDKSLTNMCFDENDKNKFDVAGFFRHSQDSLCIYLPTILLSTYYGTIEHEFGHFIDYSFGWISETILYTTIFQEEKERFKKLESNEYYQTPKEYFAECYYYYLISPNKLKQYCPRTYNFFEVIMNENDCY